jgi:hypothetical protein
MARDYIEINHESKQVHECEIESHQYNDIEEGSPVLKSHCKKISGQQNQDGSHKIDEILNKKVIVILG